MFYKILLQWSCRDELHLGMYAHDWLLYDTGLLNWIEGITIV